MWVADNGTEVSVRCNTDGSVVPLDVTIARAATSTEGGNPTGIVFNSTGGFVISEANRSGPAFFIFVSEDGVISGWNPQVDPDHAVVALDHGNREAIYKGAALAMTNAGPRLYVTNFHAGTVQVSNQNFARVLVNNFVDPN